MRYAFWTPLPPEPTGIADYSAELLSAFAPLGDVLAIVRDPKNARPPTGVPVAGEPRPSEPLLGEPRRGIVSVYHLGDDPRFNGWIYDRALDEPGVLLLHHPSLLRLVAARCGGPDTAEFGDEVRHAHGPLWGVTDDAGLADGWPAIEVDGVPVVDPATLTLERRVVSASRAVVVHDPCSAAWLRGRYPEIPVHVVPHGVRIRDDTGRSAARERLGWADDDVVFAITGDRTMVSALAFAEVRRRWPRARLLIMGQAGTVDTDVLDNLGDSVRVAPEPGPAITAADAVVHLDLPTAGETSAVIMQALGAGRAVITGDLPQYRHLDESFCWRLPLDPADEALALLDRLTRVLSDPDEARAAGRRARDFAAQQHAWPVAAARLKQALDEVAARPGPARPAVAGTSDVSGISDVPGVNVFGDVRATTGLAESVRRHGMALLDAGVDLTFTEVSSRAHNRSVAPPPELLALRRGKEHPIDLWLVNVSEFFLIPRDALDRYTIALWAWEFLEVPPHVLTELSRMDELWVVSSFVAQAFRAVTDIPITVIPNVVAVDPDTTADRARFGLHDDAVVVLFSFSASSSDARKNPWGVIEAFRRAFPPGERGRTAQLVIKAIDLHLYPELDAALREAVETVDGVLIDTDLTRAEMDTLLASCDIYLSLHRSEGFGFGMAEAMALAKPVIATGYSGNLDFMPPGSAVTVGYRIRPVVERDHRLCPQFLNHYRPGHLWAEPDVDQAARWLRLLANSPARRRELGLRGAAAIDSICSRKAVGAAMVRRLREIGDTLSDTPSYTLRTTDER